EDLEPLVDTTEALTVHSKRTQRAQKRRAKAQKSKQQHRGLLDLPCELILEILTLLTPKDVFALLRVNAGLRTFILEDEHKIAKEIMAWRYACLTKCFRLPVLIEDVDPEVRPCLQSDERQQLIGIHKKFQHMKPWDPALICTCMTCVFRWNALCLVVDFAHWQDNLDKGEPIPMVPRGRNPKWHQKIINRNAAVVEKALSSPLWHARILEAHLIATMRAIRRHAANKGNKRTRFRMTHQDIESGTDAYLSRSGPPTLDIPFHRDQYYMLESYLPNRGWNGEKNEWVYMPAQQHDTDVQ
ncbi:uncharacterized protein BCR38DRAFT_319986, partial [Pseudomassariella vexata]